MTLRYLRAHFVRDAQWMGLSPAEASCRKKLRERRDRMMIRHHPDFGGDAEMAARINETYARMRAWLDKRARTRRYNEDLETARENDRAESSQRAKASVRRSLKIGLSALAALGYLGYAAFLKRRR